MNRNETKLALWLALWALCAAPCFAQYIGSVSPLSDQETLAPPLTACTGVDQIFPVRNLGQGNHYAAAQPVGTTSFQMEIDGVDKTGNIYRISDLQHSTPGYLGAALAGSGYFPIIQVKVRCRPFGAGAGTFTLTYSGGPMISPINSGSFALSQSDKALFTGVDATHAQSVTTQPPSGNTRGTLVFAYQAAASAGAELGVYCSGSISPVSYASSVFYPAAAVGYQIFAVPPQDCPYATVIYTPGVGGATFNLEYVFTNGFAPAAFEKGPRWIVTHSPAAAAQATASKAAGSAAIRHVADCLSYSAGAIAAPAATQLTINLRDGATGAGAVLWSKTVAIPATAANHFDGNFCGLNVPGTLATAMTLEFSAGLANEFESVSLTGYDTN